MTGFKEPLKIITDARSLLSDPDKWTTGAAAKTEDGEHTNGFNPEAVCFCMIGALEHCSEGSDLAAYKAGSVLRRGLGETIAGFNDRPTTTHASMLAKLDEVIELNTWRGLEYDAHISHG